MISADSGNVPSSQTALGHVRHRSVWESSQEAALGFPRLFSPKDERGVLASSLVMGRLFFQERRGQFDKNMENPLIPSLSSLAGSFPMALEADLLVPDASGRRSLISSGLFESVLTKTRPERSNEDSLDAKVT